MNRRHLLRAAIGALALVILPAALACGDDDGASNGNERITLMLNWTPNNHHAGIYIAMKEGWYRDEGLDVQIIEPAAGGVAAVVAAGQADFGISVQEAVIPARAQGLPIVSIAAILQHNDSSFMALARTGITRPRDFAGHTYGGYGGALETEILKTLVACDGGDPERIKMVEVGNVDYLSGMEQGRFDFVWVFEGWDVLRARAVEKKDINTVKFVDYLDCIPDWYTPLIITNERTIAQRPETVRKFLRATTRGYELAMRDPVAAADALMAGAPELDEALVRASAEYHRDKYVDAGRQWGLQDLETWRTFEAFLRQAGLTDREVDVSKAFTNEFLPRD
jgi:ABC-type nitrate/sulfonate/bicarbonate transport system substrate-binding protein